MKKPILIALGSALVTSALMLANPGIARAEPLRTEVSLVRTADLDLSTAHGQRALDARLGQAARAVCGEASSADLAGRNAARACREDALVRARTDSRQMLALARRDPVIAVTAAR